MDAACSASHCSYGIIIRDSDSRFLEASYGYFDSSNPLEAEGVALLKALQILSKRAFCFFIVESDALELIQLVSATSSVWPWKLRNLLSQIINLFPGNGCAGITLQFVYRSANMAAHLLARTALSGPQQCQLTTLPAHITTTLDHELII